ncbi:MAG: transcriptional regulator [Anaerolineales bacterium]|nr:transcriptional regulator [Anaerolineales bacterium]
MPEKIDDLYSFDRMIHEPARLAIMAVLWACESADFKYLSMATGLSKGNLSAQLKKLEKEGYLQITKTFKGSYPNTSAALTKDGRKAFDAYRRSYLKLAKELS